MRAPWVSASTTCRQKSKPALTSSAWCSRPRREERIASPARSWAVKIRPIRPRAAWLWLVCSASVLFPESIVPVKNWSSAIGEDHAMRTPLVTAAELARLLPDVTVLDVRYQMGGPGGLEEYAAGHVPGAAYVDLDTDLADPPGSRGRHPLPDLERFGAAMRRGGGGGGRPGGGLRGV